MHANGSGAFGTFTVTHDITKYTKASVFGGVGKKTDLFVRFSTVAGERGAADAERDIRAKSTSYSRLRFLRSTCGSVPVIRRVAAQGLRMRRPAGKARYE